MADGAALRVFTDGACSGNPGPGGWAWASSVHHFGSGGEAETTNNRMELKAVLDALEQNVGPLVVVMDSTYVKDGLEKWHKGWVRNGWRTKGGSPVKNRDIWEPLVELVGRRGDELRFEWVKGHSGDLMNDLVDRLAVEQRDLHRAGGPGAPVGSGGGARLADLSRADQRDERRRRDGRIPAGHLLVVLGQRPPEVEGEVATRVKRHLQELFEAQATLRADLVVVTGLREGTERLAAEAALLADVPYVVVLPFPDPHLRSAATDQARFVDLCGRAREVVTLEKKVPEDRDGFAKAMARRDSWLARVADEAILVWDEVDERFNNLHRGLDDHLGADLVVLHP
jgi:ribonuclease HI